MQSESKLLEIVSDHVAGACDQPLESLAKLDRQRSHAVVNDHEAITAAFIRDPQAEFPTAAMKDSIVAEVGQGKTRFTNASGLVQALLGNAMGANLFLLGYAYQLGLVPVAASSIEAAIRLNAVEVEANIQAFAWGRQAALDPARIDDLARSPGQAPEPLDDLQAIIDWRSEFLREYQDARYMDRYRQLVEMFNLGMITLPGLNKLMESRKSVCACP